MGWQWLCSYLLKWFITAVDMQLHWTWWTTKTAPFSVHDIDAAIQSKMKFVLVHVCVFLK